MVLPGADTRDQEGEQDKREREMNELAEAGSSESVIHLGSDQGNERFPFLLSPIPEHFKYRTHHK